MKSFSYTELDMLAGEVLPERAVLSTLLVGGGDNENENANLNLGGHGNDGGDDTTVVHSTCTSVNAQPQGGLVGALGLSSNNPVVSQICQPTASSTSA
ncbi:hypothetical protein [Actinomadura sediminis]|uniref:Uncharacterized protein n=1 Tax=Actinomadura sediminis TaxID=1038904 RepID=A0ABW3EIY3_9ACTN